MRKLLLLLLLFPLLSVAATPLPPDQAYRFSHAKADGNIVEVQWRVTPGYYLYQDTFSFDIESPENLGIGKIIFPEGKQKEDEFQGEYMAYDGTLRLQLPILGRTTEAVKIKVGYQGCAEDGYCYPPLEKFISIKLPALATQAALTQNEQDKASQLLADQSLIAVILGFFGFGLLLSFTPCVLPMIPILSGIIVGHGEKITTRKAFSLSAFYVLGMSVTYAIAGMLIGFLGSNLQAAFQNPWVIISFSLLFVLLALSLFGHVNLKLPDKFEGRIANISHKQKSGHYFGVFFMGVLATLIVSPCVTAPLVGVLTYIGQTGDGVFGGTALFAMGLGMGVPLLLIGTSAGKLIPKAGPWMTGIKYIFGLMFLGLAIYLLERIIPATAAMILWAGLLIITAVYMGALRTASTRALSIVRGLGVIVLVYGVIMIIGASLGNTDPFKPLDNVLNKKAPTLPFQSANTIIEIEKAISDAVAENKPLMIDFYADWCIACKHMDKYTFSHPDVINALENYVLLQTDVTANDKNDKSLLKHFNVIAPPTILFFGLDGREIESKRIVGEMDAQEFLEHLN